MSETHFEPEPKMLSGAATRRTVLRVIALTGGTVAVAACGSDNQTAGGPSTAGGSPSPAAATSSPAASPSESPSAAESSPAARRTASKAPAGPSVAASAIPVGGGVILSDAGYVVTQPSKGTYKAFTSTCTHMACTVTEVVRGVIHCDCHGSEFSIKDGSVVSPPASRPLDQHKVTVSGGRIYVT